MITSIILENKATNPIPVRVLRFAFYFCFRIVTEKGYHHNSRRAGMLGLLQWQLQNLSGHDIKDSASCSASKFDINSTPINGTPFWEKGTSCGVWRYLNLVRNSLLKKIACRN